MAQESVYTGSPDTISGKKIATESSVDDVNVEIQQLIPKGTPAPNSIVASPLRTSVSTEDSTDLSIFIQDTAEVLDVDNGTTVCVSMTDEASDGENTITPVFLDSAGEILGVGEAKVCTVSTLEDGSSSEKYFAPMEMWDTFGATEVMIHVTTITGTGNNIDIYAYII